MHAVCAASTDDRNKDCIRIFPFAQFNADRGSLCFYSKVPPILHHVQWVIILHLPLNPRLKFFAAIPVSKYRAWRTCLIVNAWKVLWCLEIKESREQWFRCPCSFLFNAGQKTPRLQCFALKLEEEAPELYSVETLQNRFSAFPLCDVCWSGFLFPPQSCVENATN